LDRQRKKKLPIRNFGGNTKIGHMPVVVTSIVSDYYVTLLSFSVYTIPTKYLFVLAFAALLSACGGSQEETVKLKEVATSVSIQTGDMLLGVSEARSLVLKDGRVLITGGDHGVGGVAAVQLFSLKDMAFSDGGQLIDRRFVHSVTQTSGNGLIVAGGFNSDDRFLNSVERIDPDARSSEPLKVLCVPRDNQSAIPLSNGRILFVGGDSDALGYISTVEVYDPVSSQSDCSMTLAHGRVHEAIAKISDDVALVFGGLEVDADGVLTYLSSVERIDVKAHTVRQVASMLTGRKQFQVTALENGKLLITGGVTANGPTNLAELYDPGTDTTVAVAPMISARATHKAVLLTDGRVLVIGGIDQYWSATDSTEIFDLDTGEFVPGPKMAQIRALHVAERLADGGVLVAGGYQNNSKYTSTAEVIYIAKK
jgi:hypothetical protein